MLLFYYYCYAVLEMSGSCHTIGFMPSQVFVFFTSKLSFFTFGFFLSQAKEKIFPFWLVVASWIQNCE